MGLLGDGVVGRSVLLEFAVGVSGDRFLFLLRLRRLLLRGVGGAEEAEEVDGGAEEEALSTSTETMVERARGKQNKYELCCWLCDDAERLCGWRGL